MLCISSVSLAGIVAHPANFSTLLFLIMRILTLPHLSTVQPQVQDRLNLSVVYLSLSLFFFFWSFVFLGLYLWHMEVPRLRVQLELQLLAYATVTAMQDPSRVYNLHHSSQQQQILNPLMEAREGTCVLMVASQIPFR